jgi:hypothetical protein
LKRGGGAALRCPFVFKELHMADEQQNTTGSEAPAEEKKSGWLGKLITYSIAGLIAVVVISLQGDKKKEWFEKQHQLSVAWCKGDAQCRSAVEAHWEHCLDDNYESHRRGKYNRNYSVDESAFRTCLVESGADQLAQR